MCRKIVLVSVNSTVCGVDCDGAEMTDGLLQVKDCIGKFVCFINKTVTNIFPVQITADGHIAPVNDALSSAQWAVDIPTDCNVNVRQEI